jgi:tight adherence protein B
MDKYLPLILLAIVFLFAVSLFWFLFSLWSGSSMRQRRAVRQRLLYLSAGGNHGREKMNIYRNQALKNAGSLDRLLLSLPRISSLDRLVLRSGLPVGLYGFLFASLVLAVLATVVGAHLLPDENAAWVLGAGSSLLPFAYLKTRERAFLNQFNEQLPETIDLLSRALRSGHALTSGFSMVSEEMKNPIKSEMTAVMDEMKMGLSMKDALDNLCQRVPSTDLKFFAVAVLLQKETGGNLTEILDKIGSLIRERIQFKRQVKTLTAEGRLSALILILLPVAMFLYLYFINYEYISLLWTEKEGHYMLTGGITLMLLGAISIKKITMIEV